MTIGLHVLGTIVGLVVIRYCDGAVYGVIVGSASTVISSLSWSLFNVDPFYWSPVLSTTTIFTMAGLIVMIPSILLYNYITIKDSKKIEFHTDIPTVSKNVES